MIAEIGYQFFDFAGITHPVVGKPCTQQLQRLIADSNPVFDKLGAGRVENIFITVFIAGDCRHILIFFRQPDQRRLLVQTSRRHNQQRVGNIIFQQGFDMFGQIIVSVPYDNHAAAAHQRLPVIFAEQNSRIAVNVAPVQVNDPKRVIWIRTNCRCKFLDIFGLQSLVAAVNYRAA